MSSVIETLNFQKGMAAKRKRTEDLELLKLAITYGIELLPFKNGGLYLNPLKRVLGLEVGLEESKRALMELSQRPELLTQLKGQRNMGFSPHKIMEPSPENPVYTVKKKGVPQGCPTSCGLSTLVLDLITRNNINYRTGALPVMKVVMYADDGLIFSDRPEPIEAVKNYLKSIKIGMKESGSGFVKEKGVWLKSLKFCGLEYNP